MTSPFVFTSLAQDQLDACVKLDSRAHSDAWDLPRYRACLDYPYLGFVLTNSNQALDALLILQKGVEELHLLQLVVAPERRRQGIAREALQLAVKQCQQYALEKIWLELRASNYAALALYRSFGFVEEGERKNYYAAYTRVANKSAHPAAASENALLLSLNLSAFQL